MTDGLRDYQISAIQELRAAIREGHKRIMLYSPTGSGKCLGYGTPVIMADGGIKPVESIVPGDFLLGATGNKLKVKSTMIGHGDLLRVTPTKGMPYIVNADHILSLRMTGNADRVTASNGKKYLSGEIANISVRDWMASTKTFKHCAKTWRPNALEFHSQKSDLPIPPYILGAWLGDGSLHAPALTGIDQEIIAEWKKYAQSIGHGISIDTAHGTRCPTYHITNGTKHGGTMPNKFTDALRALKLFKNKKYIPAQYKVSSLSHRLELLAGIIDTDGHLSGGYYDLVFKNQELAEDIAFIARSSGLFASIVSACKKEATNGCSGPQTYYRFSICGDINKIHCRVKRKIAPARKQKKSALVSGMSIEYIGIGNYYGFEIDGDDKLFLLGDFQVTHNTEMGISVIRSAAGKDKCVGFICNRISLVNQASKRFAKSHIQHGIIQGQNSCYTRSNVLVCSIKTLAKRGYPPFDLMVIDEAHGCTAQEYVKLLQTYNNIPVIGLSATPFTRGLGQQHEWGKLFEKLVCAVTIRELIDLGFLVDCDIYAPSEPDLKGVKIVRGDYDEKQLGIAMDKSPLIGDIIEHWKKLAFGLQTVVFATSIAHSQHIVESFKEIGISAEHIDCYSTDEERKEILDRYNSGVTKVISNVSVLAEGWDSPHTACMILARPTRSLTRWIQMVGRALRPFHGKDRAIILDHSGTCHKLGYPTDDFDLSLNDGAKSEVEKPDNVVTERLPRKCPHCHFMIPAGTGLCPKCGTKMQKQDKTKHEDGELKKVDRKPVYTHDQKQMLWSESLGLMEQRKKSPGWASHLYKSLTGVWPIGLHDTPSHPSTAVINMAKHNAIRFAHSQKNKK